MKLKSNFVLIALAGAAAFLFMKSKQGQAGGGNGQGGSSDSTKAGLAAKEWFAANAGTGNIPAGAVFTVTSVIKAGNDWKVYGTTSIPLPGGYTSLLIAVSSSGQVTNTSVITA